MDLAQKPVYKLDLAAGTSVVNLTTPLVEGDDRAQTFTLELTDKGAPANLDGYSATAYFGRGKTAEAEADTIPLSGTVSGNVATITLTESCYSRSCYFSMPIRLSNGLTGQKRTYLIVRGTVVKSVDGTIIDPDGSVPSLDDLFAQIAVMERSRQAAEEATEEALAAAARADEAREGIQGDLATLSEDIVELTGYAEIKAEAEGNHYLNYNIVNGRQYEIVTSSESTINIATVDENNTEVQLVGISVAGENQILQFTATEDAVKVLFYFRAAGTVSIKDTGAAIPALETAVGGLQVAAENLKDAISTDIVSSYTENKQAFATVSGDGLIAAYRTVILEAGKTYLISCRLSVDIAATYKLGVATPNLSGWIDAEIKSIAISANGSAVYNATYTPTQPGIIAFNFSPSLLTPSGDVELYVYEITDTNQVESIINTNDLIENGFAKNSLHAYTCEHASRADSAEKADKNLVNNWYGKHALVIGDSLTAANVWQHKLYTELGMLVTNHAKGGMGMVQCVDGENGAGEFDNETGASGTLYALNVNDVTGKDLIIFFAGYNNRGTADGEVGDCYAKDGSGQNTIAGYLQYALNRIYEELAEAGNLTCRVAVVTPHCAGKYSYIDADGYDEYPAGSGLTMQTLAQIMEDVAAYNNVPCYNAWKNSGINRHTWTVYAASPTADSGLTEQGSGGKYYWNADQLHLNSAVGYPYLGERIANWVKTI